MSQRLRFEVFEEYRWGRRRFYVVDTEHRMKATGARLSRESAQDEADRLNGKELRLMLLEGEERQRA